MCNLLLYIEVYKTFRGMWANVYKPLNVIYNVSGKVEFCSLMYIGYGIEMKVLKQATQPHIYVFVTGNWWFLTLPPHLKNLKAFWSNLGNIVCY